MKSKAVLVVLLLIIQAGFGLLSPELKKHLTNAESNQRLPVQIVLKTQFDKEKLNSLVEGLPRRERRVAVARILQDFSAREQKPLLEFLESLIPSGAVADVRPLWIVNAIYCEATPEVIQQINERPEVNYINYDLVYCPDLWEPIKKQDREGKDEIAWGVQKIRAPEVWEQGFTGQGVICGHIDTGCDYTHPDLADHMWTDPNYPYHGWNFESNNNNPMDVQGHGTHTAGTVASDGTGGTQCGVAPDAQIMVCRVRTQADSVAESQCWQAMQFCVSPPLSPSNGADLYTMSLGWQISWNPHQATWRQAADNVNAAGLIQVVAAGNERYLSPPNSCRCPGNVPPPWWNPQNTGTGTLSGIMSIGATDSQDQIADFSSRGPVTWQNVSPYNDYPYPPGLTRPDMSAPGVAVKSCMIGGGYVENDGTSMATPHVAGTVCLMLSKNPNLSPRAVDSILEVTAVDLGNPGKDNDFGAGRIDALAAVDAVPGGIILKMREVLVADQSNDGYIDPGETADLMVKLLNVGQLNCANTQGVLRSLDNRLVVVDSLANWGVIPQQDSAINWNDRFALNADPSLPNGTFIPCSLYVTGESLDYSVKFGFTLRIGFPAQIMVDHDTNNCRLTVTAFGGIGYLSPSGSGSGFCYPKNGKSLMRYASLALGTDTGYVVDRYYKRPVSQIDTDFVMIDSLRSLFPPQKGHEQFSTWIADHNHPQSLQLLVLQNSYAEDSPGYDDFVILLWELQNTRPYSINNCYVGVFADFAVDSAGRDICRTDTFRQLVYVSDSMGLGPYVGIRVLEPESIAHLSAIDPVIYYYPDSCFRDAQKWGFLRGTIKLHNPSRADNWAVVASVGPINLLPSEGSRFAVAFVGGEDEASLLANADSARSWYHINIGVTEKPKLTLPIGSGLKVTPNPFTRQTTFSLSLRQNDIVTIQIYDKIGRLVKNLAKENPVVANTDFSWDGRDETGALVPRGVYFYQVLTTTERTWGKLVFTR